MAARTLRLPSLFAFLCICCLPGARALYAQAPADTRTALQIADSAEIAALARRLTANARSDSARAAALYEWVARNVAYDLRGYLAGRLDDAGAEEVYRRRVAVCGGYVALYQRMATEVGLTVAHIQGYAKGFDYREGRATKQPNHAWLAVRIRGRWRLLDPTWGAGVVSGSRFQPAFTWDWFFIDPEALAFSHFPRDARWQLLDRPLRRGEFERMPAVPRTLLDVGFSPGSIRAALLRTRVRDFPLVGALPNVRIVNAPLSGTLARNATVSVELVWPGATDVALVSGGVWTRLQRDGDRFRGAAPAASRTVSLVGRSPGTRELATVLHYTVE